MTWIQACLVGTSIVTGGFIAWVVRTVWLQAATRSWPCVPGQVIASSVRVHPGDWETRASYEPAIEYRYRIDGREYRSNRVRFGRAEFLHRGEAEAVIVRHTAGAIVPVYVHPSRPEHAVLDNAAERTGAWITAGVLVLAVYCMVVVLFWSML